MRFHHYILAADVQKMDSCSFLEQAKKHNKIGAVTDKELTFFIIESAFHDLHKPYFKLWPNAIDEMLKADFTSDKLHFPTVILNIQLPKDHEVEGVASILVARIEEKFYISVQRVESGVIFQEYQIIAIDDWVADSVVTRLITACGTIKEGVITPDILNKDLHLGVSVNTIDRAWRRGKCGWSIQCFQTN